MLAFLSFSGSPEAAPAGLALGFSSDLGSWGGGGLSGVLSKVALRSAADDSGSFTGAGFLMIWTSLGRPGGLDPAPSLAGANFFAGSSPPAG